jgi:potassium-dependent mechanosensitive channel
MLLLKMLMKNFRTVIYFSVLCAALAFQFIYLSPISVTSGYAQTQPAQGETSQTNAAGGVLSDSAIETRSTRIEGWNHTLDSIFQAINREGVSDTELQNRTAEALAIKPQAQALIEEIRPELNRYRQQLEQLGLAPEDNQQPETSVLARDRQILQQNVAALDALQRAARLVVVRIEQIESAALTKRRERFVQSLSIRSNSLLSPGLWTQSVAGLDGYLDSLNLQFSETARFAARQIRERPVQQSWLLLQCLLLLAAYLLAARWIDRRAGSKRRNIAHDSAGSRAVENIIIYVALCVLPVLLLASLALIFDYSTLFPVKFRNLLNMIIGSTALFSVASGILRLFLAPYMPERRIAHLEDRTAASVFHIGVTAMAMIAVLRVFNFSVVQLLAPFEMSVVFSALIALVAIIAVAGAMWLIRRDSELARRSAGQRNLIRWQTAAPVMWLVCAIAAIGLFAGYVALAEFIAYQILAILIIVTSLWLVLRLIDEIRERMTKGTGRRSGRPVLQSGLGLQWIILGCGLLKVVAIIIAVFALLLPWGIRSHDWLLLISRAFFGFQIGDLTISVSAILSALIIFALAIFAARQIKNWISHQYLPTTKLDTGLRNSITTILGYVGIILAVVLAIMAAGLDLTRLAIVAGALSVGIGFGLQSIVNNFVSGLILLAERPIQSGDWVVTSGGQGTIRRISVRSTEIETFDGATIVVPNSTLITEPVTNWYHRNKQGRVIITVGVSYGSDPEQVRDLLLECAREHSLVIDNPEPQVFFMDYGADALIFDLRAYLADIGYMLSVSSDLRFAILKKFREAKIEIPFPQRDLHIKSGILPIQTQTDKQYEQAQSAEPENSGVSRATGE